MWTLTEKARALGKGVGRAGAGNLSGGGYRISSRAARGQPKEAHGANEQVAPTTEVEHTSVNNQRGGCCQTAGSPAAGFERFCQRLLRESGFEEVVTGRSGDGGIDGIGILQVNPLMSFKVLFQCKRYAGSRYRVRSGTSEEP